MKTSEIITLIVALWGAVLSTVLASWQILGQRVRVKVTVRKNQQIIGDPRYRDTTLTALTVTNIGHRPVTISSFGAIGLYPNLSLAAIETHPSLPCEITEGRYVTSNWPQEGLDFSTIDYWAAWDSHGKMHKLQEANRFRHWKSVFALRRSFKEKTK